MSLLAKALRGILYSVVHSGTRKGDSRGFPFGLGKILPFSPQKNPAAVVAGFPIRWAAFYCGLRHRLRSTPHHHYQQRLLLLARKIAVRFCTEFFDSLAFLPSGEVDIVRHRRPRQQGGQLRVIALNTHTIE